MTKSLINIPSFLRAAMDGSRAVTLTGATIGSTNSTSTSSFMYDASEVPLKSTQQLSVNWENFEEHTFFSPATVNVNSAFDKIINNYPFDGTRVELEQFLENLSGYEYWVLEQFPKYRGQLHFSGGLGNFIRVNDTPGSMFPYLANDKNDGMGVILPDRDESMTVEFKYFPPPQANTNQYIINMVDATTPTLPVGFGIAVSANVSPLVGSFVFVVTSGSYTLAVTGAAYTKGVFHNIRAEFNNNNTGNQYLRLVIDDVVHDSLWAETTRIGDLRTAGVPLLIGSGTAVTLPGMGGYVFTPATTLTGVLDEFRIFKSIRTQEDLDNFEPRSVFAQNDLVLYYKFNEPPPPLVPDDPSLDAIVLDSSGNSLHAVVTNFVGSLRINASGSVYGDPMSIERELFCPVLFPGHSDVITLNTDLLESASLYDAENPNLITRLVPKHYFLEGQSEEGLITEDGTIVDSYTGTSIPGTGKLGSSQLLMSLLYTYARFFDEIKMYIDAFSTTQYVSYDRTDSTPDTFLSKLLVQRGFVSPPIFSHSTIEQYVDAENVQYPVSAGTNSLRYVQNELLRRLLTNLPAIIRSKGTQYSIKAFLRAMGIDPENSCRIREYGGPTQQTLGLARDTRQQIGSMVTFEPTTRFASKYLSGSRLEAGYPDVQGTMVQPLDFPPHGISNNESDGLYTSGSFTVESIVKFLPNRTGSLTGADSIVRLFTTGSTASPWLVANLVATSGSSPYLTLYVRQDTSTTAPLLSLNLTDSDVYDGDLWNISFGRIRNDDPASIHSDVSSSYFIRAAKVTGGSIVEYNTTSSLLGSTGVNVNVFESRNVTYNASGAYIAVGTNDVFPVGAGAGVRMLNNTVAAPAAAREVTFTGQESNLRFWSKALTDIEWKEHVKNFKSVGTIDPLVNYNFTHSPSGSFERLRLDTFSKQPIIAADSGGSITLLDFTGNELHMSGSGYTASSTVLVPQLFSVSYISPTFDQPTTNEKVRPRSFFDQTNIDDHPGSSVAPVYEIEPSEQPQDDVRLAVEFSLIDALNRDIITIFSTLEAIDNAIGDPALLFSPDYPDLDRLRDIYFNRLTSKLNFKAFHEFFKFFDMSLATFIEQLVPKKTKFKGVNFIIESHMLERHKLEYFSNEIYLGEFDRFDLSHSLLLQQLVGVLKKY